MALVGLLSGMKPWSLPRPVYTGLHNAGNVTTRFWDADIGSDVGYCAVDARWKSNKWRSAERETACWGRHQPRFSGHAPSLTEWCHRCLSCMQTRDGQKYGRRIRPNFRLGNLWLFGRSANIWCHLWLRICGFLCSPLALTKVNKVNYLL